MLGGKKIGSKKEWIKENMSSKIFFLGKLSSTKFWTKKICVKENLKLQKIYALNICYEWNISEICIRYPIDM